MTGKEMREMIISAGLKLWQIGDELGMRDNNFSRRLRHDFSEEETSKIKSIIEALQNK